MTDKEPKVEFHQRPVLAPGLSQHGRKGLDRLFAYWIPPTQTEEDTDWVSDADWARQQQAPLRARYLVRWVGGLLVLFLIWAAIAQVDEVTRGIGKVTPSRQVQVIQAVDGGIISEILVREGQMVEIGQLLFSIDTTRFTSSVRENRVQYLALLTKADKLNRQESVLALKSISAELGCAETPILTSAKNGQGIKELWGALVKKIQEPGAGCRDTG